MSKNKDKLDKSTSDLIELADEELNKVVGGDKQNKDAVSIYNLLKDNIEMWQTENDSDNN